MKHNQKSYNIKPKLQNVAWDVVTMHALMALACIIMAGSMTYNELEKRRALYNPGKSLTQKERAAVDSLHNPALEHAKKKYDMYYQDYMRALKNAPVFKAFQHPLPNNHRMPESKYCGTPTVGKYFQFLKDYEQNVIEKKYQELNLELQKQR